MSPGGGPGWEDIQTLKMDPDLKIDLWVYEDDEDSLWPKRRYDDRPLHGVAFPDHSEPGCLVVRYVGKNEDDAKAFAAAKGGTYVTALEESEVTRSDWQIQPAKETT